jgi:hypothetical protein
MHYYNQIGRIDAEIRHIKGDVPDADGVCSRCEERTANTTLYLTDEDGDQDIWYTCDALTCIARVIDLWHLGDSTPEVEVKGPSVPVTAIDNEGPVITTAA